jgi:hypothetical protein
MTSPPRAGRCLASGTLWLAAFLVARLVLERTDLSPATRVLVALVPVVPFAWFLWALAAQMRRLDELERRIQLEALAFAFPLAMLFLMGLGLMELAVPLSKDDWSFRHVWAMLPMLYFLGLALARWRYQ